MKSLFYGMLFMLSVASATLGESLKGCVYLIEEKTNDASTPAECLMKNIRTYVKAGWKPSKSLSWNQVDGTQQTQTFSLSRNPTRMVRQMLCIRDSVLPFVLIYQGKVKAPFSGKFRFVGTGDDVLLVRWNRKLVLEGGYMLPTVGIQSVSRSESDCCPQTGGARVRHHESARRLLLEC